MPFTTMWMDLESIMLSEISQTGKDTYSMLSLISSEAFLKKYAEYCVGLGVGTISGGRKAS